MLCVGWRGYKDRKRRGRSVWGSRKKAKTQDYEDDEEEDEGPQRQAFITAKDQHVLEYNSHFVRGSYSVCIYTAVESAEEVWRTCQSCR